MASPFSIFRKHERWLMAVLVIMAMVAFIFFDPIFGVRSGGRNGPKDPVAAESSLYGDIHESELLRMRSAKNLANRFVQQTMAAGQGYAYDTFFGPETEAAALDTMLLARKATALGMRITDVEISRFLDEIGNHRVTADQFGQILHALGGGRKGSLSKRELYDALRNELLAQHVTNALIGIQHTTPAQRWESYQRLNSRASVELIPVAVADFLDKVPDPDEATLAKFFDTYKNFEAMPGSPLPGFRIPNKVALQYFVAEYDDFVKPDEVTQEEIQHEYDQNKDTRYLYSGDFRLGNQDKPAEGEEKPAGDEAQPGDSKTPADGETPVESEKPAEGADNAAPDAAAGPAEPAAPPEPAATSDQPAAPPVEQPKTEAAPPADPPQQNDSRASRDRFGLTGTELALADDPPAEPATTEPAATEPAAAEPATPAPESAPGSGATAEPASTTSAAPADANPAAPADAAASPAATGDASPPRPKHDPLEKVEAAIRNTLAGQKAVKRMDEALTKAREKMVKYGSAWITWDARHDRDKSLVQPQPLDFDAIAQELNLSTHTTELLSARELSMVEGIGESFLGRDPFVAYAFGSWQLFQAVMSIDNANNQYLAWKIDQRPARVPKLDEIRDDVVRAWKMIEARKPAFEHAKSLKESAEKDKMTLAQLAERDKLAELNPPEFSWLTYGSTPAYNNRTPPRLSQVEGVEDAGNGFMQAIFSLQDAGIGVAFNNPQTICYAAQVKQFEPGLEVLRRTFLADNYSTYRQVDAPQQQQAYEIWTNSVKREAGLKWARQPDARAPQGESEAGD